MSNLKAKNINVIKANIIKIYSPDLKYEIDESYVEKKVDYFYKMLKKLPKSFRKHFNSLTSELLKNYDNDKSIETSYNITWLGIKLLNINNGSEFKNYLCYDWDLEYSFYKACENMLNEEA